MSDLIDRLRLWCPPDEPPTDEAADEIERLNGRISELEDHCDRITKTCSALANGEK